MRPASLPSPPTCLRNVAGVHKERSRHPPPRNVSLGKTETVAVALLNGSKVAERWDPRTLNEASLKESGFLPEAGKQYFIWSLIAARGPRVAHQTNCNGTECEWQRLPAPLGFPARSRGRYRTEAGRFTPSEQKRKENRLSFHWVGRAARTVFPQKGSTEQR